MENGNWRSFERSDWTRVLSDEFVFTWRLQLAWFGWKESRKRTQTRPWCQLTRRLLALPSLLKREKEPTLVWIETLEIRSLVDGTRSLPTRRTARFNDERSHTCPCGLGNVSIRDWVSNRGEVARQRNNKPGWEIWQTQHQRSCLLLLQGKLERRDEILFYFNNSAAQDNRPDGQRQDWESRLERLNSRLRRPVPDWSEEELIK